MLHIANVQVSRMTLRKIRDAQETHRGFQLVFHDCDLLASSFYTTLKLLTVDEVLDTFSTICQRVQERSTHSHCFCTQAQGFDDVCATPNAAVDVDFEVLEDFRVMFSDFEKCEQ